MDSTLEAGTVLENRYEISCRLNEGGTASVYRAKRLGINEDITVAIKEISPEILTRAEFQNEVSLLMRLRHENLPKVYDFFEHGGKYYLVMDFVEGPTLAARVKDIGPFTADEAIDIGLQIANVFTYLHSAHVIHRDLKPENVMMDPDGQVKIIDFGVAKSENAEGVFAYSEGTSAPEQRISGASDERSDIYSFGATMYYLLSGRYPSEIVKVAPVEGRTIKRDAHIPADFEPIIRRCVAKQPTDRYQSMREIIDALDGLKAQIDGEALVGSEPPRGKRSILRAAIAFAAIAALLIGFRLIQTRGHILPPPVVAVTYTLAGPTQLSAGADGSFSVSPAPQGPVTWEIYEATQPRRLLRTEQGNPAVLHFASMGLYSVVAKSDEQVLGEVPQIAIQPDFALRKKVIQGYQMVLRPTLTEDALAVPTQWDWTITDPLGKAQTKRSQDGSLVYVFKEIGVYKVQLSAAYQVSGGSEVVAAGPDRMIEVVRDTAPGIALNPNPSFEEPFETGIVGWTLVSSHVAVDPKVAYNGGQSVKITGPTDATGSYAAQKFVLQSSGHYTVTARVRGRAVSGRERMELRFRSATKDEYIAKLVRTSDTWSGDFDWQKLELSFEAPADEFVLEIYLSLEGRGTVWFDQCIVSKH